MLAIVGSLRGSPLAEEEDEADVENDDDMKRSGDAMAATMGRKGETDGATKACDRLKLSVRRNMVKMVEEQTKENIDLISRPNS